MSAPSWTTPAYEAIAALLRRRTGLEFPSNRREGAELGTRKVMARAGVRDAAEYLRLLESGAVPLDDLTAELTVGETYFFREPAQFELLRRRVLPELLRARGPDRVVRAWSAGCATGEEAYSLAILLEQEGLAGRSRVLATDISRPSLARSREAVYGEWSFRAVDPPFMERYFKPLGGRWAIDRRFTKSVDFEYMNLALDNYPSLVSGIWGLDLILCRNVLIYFSRETVRNAARRLHASLADGGWLLTAPADPPLGELAPWETVVTPDGIFYRRRPASWSCPPLDIPSEAVPGDIEPGQAPRTPPAPEAAGTEAPRAPEAAPELGRDVEEIRAAAGRDGAQEGERVAARALERLPLSAELHFLRALLLLELQREEEAAAAIRRALYLDRSLAIAHFLLGGVLRRLGDAAGARRAYRNALCLGAALPPDGLVPLSDGERAEQLVRAARAQLALLEEAS